MMRLLVASFTGSLARPRPTLIMDSLALKEYILFPKVDVTTTLYFLSQYTAGGVCHSKALLNALLNAKTAVVMGANGGIGKETAVDLAR